LSNHDDDQDDVPSSAPGLPPPTKDPSLKPATKTEDQYGPAPFRAQFWHDLAIFLRLTFHFWKGFHFMRGTRRAITVFGSARLPQEHPYCQSARQVAGIFGKKGFTIITGGGPSIMQAANQGAYEAGAKSIGINIMIPREQNLNSYVTHGVRMRYFFVRKVLLCRYSEAFIVYPGGFGTLDEAFELVTLIQTGKMVDRPILLVGRKFWSGLLDWMRRSMLAEGMINEREFSRLRVVDTAEEIAEYLDQRLHQI
jgi:uncharacterized protein (TIGR00730 family)